MKWFWKRVLKTGLGLVRWYNRNHPPVQWDQEDDGRYIAEFPDVPGAMAYGATAEEAEANARKLLPKFKF
jgi:hypothetical protein